MLERVLTLFNALSTTIKNVAVFGAIMLALFLGYKGCAAYKENGALKNRVSESQKVVSELQKQIENAPTSSTIVIQKPLSCRPPDSVEYRYDSDFLSVRDTLVWKDGAYISQGAKVIIQKKTNDTLVETLPTPKQDKTFRARPTVTITYGSFGTGIGVGLDFLNLKRVTGAELGLTVHLVGVSDNWRNSHTSVGVVYRFLRNAGVEAGYDRSLFGDGVHLGIAFYPAD